MTMACVLRLSTFVFVSVALAAGFKLLLPHLPPDVAAFPDVTGSMLVQRFTLPTGVITAPPSLAPTLLKIDLTHALSAKMIPFISAYLPAKLDTCGLPECGGIMILSLPALQPRRRRMPYIPQFVNGRLATHSG